MLLYKPAMLHFCIKYVFLVNIIFVGHWDFSLSVGRYRDTASVVLIKRTVKSS